MLRIGTSETGPTCVAIYNEFGIFKCYMILVFMYHSSPCILQSLSAYVLTLQTSNQNVRQFYWFNIESSILYNDLVSVNIVIDVFPSSFFLINALRYI